MFRFLSACLMVLMVNCWVSQAHATTLILQSGEKIEGQIVEQNDMRMLVDVQGRPRTFYIGEIASIDGKEVEVSSLKVEDPIPQAMPQANPDPVAKVAVPFYNDEQVSLERFMSLRNSSASQENNSVKNEVVVTQPPPAPVENNPPKMIDQVGVKTGDVNKNVVVTPDGGIIVVGSQSIVKYDKDLNVVKKIDLNVDNASAAPAIMPPAVTPPPASPVPVAAPGNQGYVGH